jgi:integrase/recombinase XerD
VTRGKRAAGGASPAVTAFLEMMAAERGAAANTLAAYARDLAGAEALSAIWWKPMPRR